MCSVCSVIQTELRVRRPCPYDTMPELLVVRITEDAEDAEGRGFSVLRSVSSVCSVLQVELRVRRPRPTMLSETGFSG